MGGKVKKKPSRESIVPYVVPPTYLTDRSTARRVGHEMWAMLATDLGELVTNIRVEELASFGVGSVDEAWPIALENLERIFARDVQTHVFPPDEGKPPFILCGGHWLAATCVLLPRLHAFAANALGTIDLLVSIPQRDALVIFPRATVVERDAMRAQIRIAEADARKPLTWELFALAPEGISEFREDGT